MYKELIICTVIIIIIVTLDIFLQNSTKNSTTEIEEILSEIKESVENKDTAKQNDKLNLLDQTWEDKHNKLAYYIEHDELEKVDSSIVKVRHFLENGDIPSAIAELETGKFVLKHIEDKYKFNFQNIF